MPLQTQGWVTLDWKHPYGSCLRALGSWLLRLECSVMRLPLASPLGCSLHAPPTPGTAGSPKPAASAAWPSHVQLVTWHLCGAGHWAQKQAVDFPLLPRSRECGVWPFVS